MTHDPHPDVHTHGLADRCGACLLAAELPLAFLDEDILRDLVQRVTREDPPRSTAEGIALTNVREVLNRYARLALLEPAALDWLARWGVPGFQIGETSVPAPAAPQDAAEAVGTASTTEPGQ